MNEVRWHKSDLSANDGQVVWHKSSLSTDISTCVEVGVWKTSTLSDASGPWCVEVAGGADLEEILVRDTKDNGNGPVLRFTPNEFRAFIGGVKLGEFDLPD